MVRTETQDEVRSMLKPTLQLFIKALVIGVLVNVSLHYAGSAALPVDENPQPAPQIQSLHQSDSN